MTGSIGLANQPAPSSGETSTSESNVININIITNAEKKGLELGTNGYSRGNSSITTGTNNIAIGTSAVATGGNEDKDTINRKIQENKQRLDEITRQEETVRNESKELEKLRLRYSETIEAGNRVNALKLSQRNAYAEYERLKNARLQLERESEARLQDHRNKLEDFNNRLKAIENIGSVNLASDQDLESKATDFKTRVEQGTNLNLDVAFYKDYIKSHYKALGDLRLNEIISSHQNYDEFNNLYNRLLGREDRVVDYGYRGLYHLNYSNYVPYVAGKSLAFRDYSVIGIEKDGNLKQELNLRDEDFPSVYKFNTVNIRTTVIDDNTMSNVRSDKIKFKNIFSKAVDKAFKYHLQNNIINQNQLDTVKNSINLRLDIIEMQNEVANLQWKYEQSGNSDTRYLDQKKIKMRELERAETLLRKIVNDPTTLSDIEKSKYLVEYNNNYYTISRYMRIKVNEWNKANITDIKERNKITTDKLTSDLERELGINKSAILEIERNIQNAKDSESRALNNYNNITISERDLLLSREYEEVVRKIKAKETILLTATERLETLKRELTLNEFRDGENAIAFGNNTLASGTNSIAFGKGSIATSESGIAIGNTNLTTGESSIAIGHGNNSIGTNSIALGRENSVKGDKSITIGYKNKLNGVGSTVIGDPNEIYGNNNHVLGNDNRVGADGAGKDNNFILGSNVNATNVENSITLGNNSTAVSNTVSVGSANATRKITNVSEGDINATSTDVITGKQLYALANATSINIDVDKWKEKLGVGESAGASDVANKEEFVRNSTDGSNSIILKGYETKHILKPDDKVNVADLKNIQSDEKDQIVGKLKEKNDFLNNTPNTTYEISKDKKYLDVMIDGKKVASIPIKDLATGTTNNDDTDIVNAKPFDYTGTNIYIPKDGTIKITNVSDGVVSETSTDAINGKVLYSKLLEKLNVNGDNLTDTGRTNLRAKLSENASVDSPVGALVTDTVLKSTLDGKLTNDNISGLLRKGNLTSTTLGLVNNTNRLLGEEDLIINLKDDSVETRHIKNNAITGDKIADATISGDKLINGTITGDKIADTTISGDKLINGTITGDKIADTTISGDKLINGTITGDKIADATISGSKLINGTITGDKIADATINTNNIVDGAVNGDKIANNSILDKHIADNSLNGNKIKDGTLDGSKIKDGSINEDKLSDALKNKLNATGFSADDITNDLINEKLEKGSIKSSSIVITNGSNRILGASDLTIELKENSIDNRHIADNTISGDKILDNSIDNSKLKDNNIDGSKLKDNSIDNSKLKDNNIDGSKLKDNSIDNSKLKDNNIDGSKLKDNSIDNSKLKDNNIDGSKLKDNSIDNSKLKDNNIDGSKLKDNSIDNSKLKDNNIDGNKLKDGSISGSKIAENSISKNNLTEALRNELDGKLGRNDLTGELISNSLNKGNIVSSSLTIINGNGRIIGLDELSIDLKENSINGNHIVNGAITGDKIADNSISDKHIADNSLNGNKIKDNTLDGSKIKDNSINKDKLSNDLKNELDGKANKSDLNDEFAKKDGSNLTDENIDAWRGKLGIAGGSFNISYTNEKRDTLSLGRNDTPTRIENVADPVEPLDAANKKYVDEKASDILNATNTMTSSMVNNAVAMSHIPQVSADKLFSFGAGVAYNGGKVGSAAIGISGQDKNKKVVYKASAGLSTDLKWQLGAGFNYNIGKTNSEIGEKDVKDLTNKLGELQSELDSLRASKDKSAETDKLLKVIEKMQKDINDLKSKPTQSTSGLTTHRVLGYEVGVSKLTKEQYTQLTSMVKELRGKEVHIIGYADTKGEDKNNLTLGLNRAREVAKFLASKGVTIKTIKSGGYNSVIDYPGTNEFKNRRVEIVVK